MAECTGRRLGSLWAQRRKWECILEPRGEAHASVPPSPVCLRRWQTAKAVGSAEVTGGGENYLGEEGRGLGRFPDPWMDNAGGANLFAGLSELESLTPESSPELGKKEWNGAVKARGCSGKVRNASREAGEAL